MGTTVSSNLSLIKPDLAESIKANLPTFDGWAAQNGANMDKIDSLFRDDVISAYTLNWTATVGNPTLGAGGFTEGKYIRFFPRMVAVFFRIFTGGAGFAVGSGLYRINLPVAVDPAFASFTHTMPLGKAIYSDNSAILTSSVFTPIYSPSAGFVFFRPSAGGTWDPATPVIPAQNDRLSGYLLYPTAVP
jgi:hypothetical protein